MAEPVFIAGPGSKRFAGPQRMLVGLTLEGLPALTAALKALGPKAPKALGRALYLEAERIMTAAKKQTPVDIGNLRASGHVALPVITAEAASVVLGFGGPAGVGNQGETNSKEVGYAVYVHEDLTKSHLKPQKGGGLAPSGNAKYLERPMMEAAPGLEGRLAARISGEIGK